MGESVCRWEQPPRPASHPPVAPAPPDRCSAPTSDTPPAPPSAASRGDPDAQHQGLLTDGAAGAWPAFSLVRKFRTRGHYPQAEVLCAVKCSRWVPPGLYRGAGPALPRGVRQRCSMPHWLCGGTSAPCLGAAVSLPACARRPRAGGLMPPCLPCPRLSLQAGGIRY